MRNAFYATQKESALGRVRTHKYAHLCSGASRVEPGAFRAQVKRTEPRAIRDTTDDLFNRADRKISAVSDFLREGEGGVGSPAEKPLCPAVKHARP